MNRWPLIVVIAALLFLGQLLASTSAQASTATASASSELTLVILPALEATVISSSAPTEQERIISQQFTLGVRANTAWALETSLTSTATKQGSCQTDKAAGQRNQDDSYQLITVDCQQPQSWADPPGVVEIVWQVTPAVGGDLGD